MTLANRLKSKINLCLLSKQIEHFYFYNLNTYLKRTRQDQLNDTTPRFSSAVLLFAACRDAACAAILRAAFRGTRKSYRGTALIQNDPLRKPCHIPSGTLSLENNKGSSNIQINSGL